ncbi:treacle protein isoform X2 [Coturnix japonica]|uniref:treacle protein isoform X2 n=1 Tax=Coturnix japonica TaxID=93934 RepID=UPI0007780035|nr:treacle protein isoform X2 [Coturnix japonica]XP_015731210.1 treacle protein isoform X2 [Coturnix japonica]
MAALSGGRRELLALIHQHLMRAGFARAARELQAQLGQKLLPSLATTLEEIFTHWERTPSKARRRKLTDEEVAIPEKIRVPDPVSSSESSEKEEDEKEKAKTGNATGVSPVTNSAVNVESSEDDDSSSEEETLSGKGAVTVTPAVASGKAANSLHSPVKPAAPGSKVAVPSAANRTVLSNKQQPSASVVTPAKAGQKLPGPGKPGGAVAAVSQAGQSKAPIITKAPESSSSSSSSSESEEEKETPTVKTPAPKVELKQAAGKAESSSEESSDETSSEEELATTAVQSASQFPVPPVKAVQVNSTPVKTAPATSVSSKKSTVKQSTVTLNQTKPGSVTVPVAAKPDDTSESSDSSDSGNEEPPSVTQSKPSLKTSQAIPSPVKTTPAASLSSKATPAKTPSLSQGKPASKPAVLKQAKATPGRTAAPAKPAESTNPAESTDSSGSEEEDLPVPVSQKRLSEQTGPVPNLSQAAKAVTSEKAGGSTLKNETSESGSSDSSDSEEETPVSQTQPALPAVKSNAVPQPTSVKKVPAPTPAPAPSLPMDSSDDSSGESDSDEEVVPPTQTLSQQNIKPTKVSSTVAAKANATTPSGKGIKAPPIPSVSRVSESSNSDSSESDTEAGEAFPPPCLKETAPIGKPPPASPATPQAASILRSPTAKSKKPGLQPVQDARLSQTAPLTQAEESSDSSSSSDSEKETPKQPPKPGMLQKPGKTEPDDSSLSESSDDEEAVSQSLLTGYMSLSKSPAAPQAPKTVPPQPVGNTGQGKAAVNATSSLAKVSVKAAPADSSSSDSSDSDTDIEQVSANHKAESKPSPGQEATGTSNKEKGAGKTDANHANPKPSSVKKAVANKENDVEAKGTQANPLPSALLTTPQPVQSSLENKSEVTSAAGVPAVQTPDGLEEKKKKKKEKKEKKEKKKPSSTADKAVKTAKGKDKENKKQKASQKRKHPGEDGAVGQPKEKKRKGQGNEEVPKKKKKKAADDQEKLPGSKEKKKSSKKKKTGKEKKNKKMPTEGESTADGSAEVHKKKKKKKTAEPEGLL